LIRKSALHPVLKKTERGGCEVELDGKPTRRIEKCLPGRAPGSKGKYPKWKKQWKTP
jgi:hypothetical protein